MSKAVPRFKRVNPQFPAWGFPIYNVQPFGHGEAGQWLMNFGYGALANGQTSASEANIATSFINSLGTIIRACMSNIYVMEGVKVSCVSNPTRQPFSNTTGANLGAGTVASNPLPSTNAVVVSKYSGMKGQHGRGRNYFPGVPASFITAATDPDRLNATGTTAFGNFVTSMMTTALADGAIGLQPIIYTRVPKGGAVVNGSTVNNMILRTLLGTIRRRRVGRGK